MEEIHMQALYTYAAMFHKKFSKGGGWDASRNALKDWIAKQLGISVERLYIARLTHAQCEQFIAICEPYINQDNQ